MPDLETMNWLSLVTITINILLVIVLFVRIRQTSRLLRSNMKMHADLIATLAGLSAQQAEIEQTRRAMEEARSRWEVLAGAIEGHPSVVRDTFRGDVRFDRGPPAASQ